MRDSSGIGETARAEVFRADGSREEARVTLAQETILETARRLLSAALFRANGGDK